MFRTRQARTAGCGPRIEDFAILRITASLRSGTCVHTGYPRGHLAKPAGPRAGRRSLRGPPGLLPPVNATAQAEVAGHARECGQPEGDCPAGAHRDHRLPAGDSEGDEHPDHRALDTADSAGQREKAAQRAEEVPQNEDGDRWMSAERAKCASERGDVEAPVGDRPDEAGPSFT